MKTLFIDCPMGASGDMINAALLDLLENPEELIEELNGMELPEAIASFTETLKDGIKGMQFKVTIDGEEEVSEDVKPPQEKKPSPEPPKPVIPEDILRLIQSMISRPIVEVHSGQEPPKKPEPPKEKAHAPHSAENRPPEPGKEKVHGPGLSEILRQMCPESEKPPKAGPDIMEELIQKGIIANPKARPKEHRHPHNPGHCRHTHPECPPLEIHIHLDGLEMPEMPEPIVEGIAAVLNSMAQYPKHAHKCKHKGHKHHHRKNLHGRHKHGRSEKISARHAHGRRKSRKSVNRSAKRTSGAFDTTGSALHRARKK